MGFLTEPRFTKDLDVLVGIDSESSVRLYEALREFGAPLFGLKSQEFLQADFVVLIGSPPWRIDILTSIPGVDFDAAYADRLTVTLGGIPVSCISREWLIKAKSASGRSQDLTDLEALERANECN